MHESFLAHARFRYLKVALVLAAVSITVYAAHRPPVPAYGGTWLGYTLGTAGAVLIVWLSWLGVRKRQYYSKAGTLSGWLSAHVYLGVTLLVIVTLHTGFHFGWNVHTLAYALMVLVIASGLFGVFAYVRYPELVTRNRDGMLAGNMLGEIAALDGELLVLADKVGGKVHEMALRSVERTAIGGNLWQQLTRRSPQRRLAARVEARIAAELSLLDQAVRGAAAPEPDAQSEATVVFMANRLGSARGADEAADVRRLLDLLSRKKALVQRLERDVQLHALMSAWLYVHVPLSVALLGALLVHVFSVFFYW